MVAIIHRGYFYRVEHNLWAGRGGGGDCDKGGGVEADMRLKDSSYSGSKG